MRRSDFRYELPPELIAQHPPAVRSAARLLCVEPGGALRDAHIADFSNELRRGDLLVFNDTRVIPARLYGEKDSGGKIEILIERVLDRREALAQIRASKAPRPGGRLHVDGTHGALLVLDREDDFFRLRWEGEGTVLELLERHGHIPLPPYIARPDAASDREHYQTIFAREPGAVAAPTAGLHFDPALVAAVRARGVDIGFVTLHVGAGTFQPVRVEEVSQHRMHPERYRVTPELAGAIGRTRRRGGRVVAVGTTVVRALESAAKENSLHASDAVSPTSAEETRGGILTVGEGETRLFITPGFRFRVVNALLTNFHLPESTLLMLVCAFGGYERVRAAYRHAVAQRYRFFSYGDAMFISGPHHG
ncbi:MAG: tRNA preQ1(34) S-adenosylmethionine ribosyltransferase-isomerase QueA [Nevskiales bacterium]|nr:tRNA preQ1(34) S-adenosylmethionine ribosyltransferase-isomerase QueA [Nevskiales bacterium]